MNHVERFRALMDFQAVDRLPRWEWAMWWDETILIRLLPVLRQTLADQGEGAAGQVGPLGPVDQHHKAAVLSQQMQERTALEIGPCQPLLPVFEVKGGG